VVEVDGHTVLRSQNEPNYDFVLRSQKTALIVRGSRKCKS
jgi:hypothetical protein